MELNGNNGLTAVEAGIQNINVEEAMEVETEADESKSRYDNETKQDQISSDTESNRCQICNEPSNSRCGGCHGVWYCGKDHQRADWKSHKLLCKTWSEVSEVKDETTGVLIYSAKKDIDIGFSIFKRRSILSYPRRLSQSEKGIMPPMTPMTLCGHHVSLHNAPPPGEILPCIGCFQILAYDTVLVRPGCQHRNARTMRNKCEKCSWPLHNPECGKLHEEECKIFAANQVLWACYQDYENIFRMLGVLRAVILKRDNSPDWKTLRKMPFKTGRPPSIWSDSHPVEKKQVEEGFDKDLEFLKDFIINVCEMGDVVSEEEVEIIYRIVWGNSFVANTIDGQDTQFCHVIFEGARGRVLPHSCVPNCDVFMNNTSSCHVPPPLQLSAIFKTILPVKAGQILTIDYDSLSVRCGHFRGLTMVSRPVVLQTQFWSDPCTCPRCSDPTENGTMFSAVRCTRKHCEGFLLPKEPNDIKQDSLWICNNGECGQTESLRNIEKRIKAGEKNLNDDLENLTMPTDKEIVREKMNSFSQSMFHPNHHGMLATLMTTFLPQQVMDFINCPTTYLHENTKDRICEHKFSLHNEYLEDAKYIAGQLEAIVPGIKNDDFNSFGDRMQFAKHLLVVSQLIEEIDKKPAALLPEFLQSKVEVLEEIYKFVEIYITPKVIPFSTGEKAEYKNYRITFNIYMDQVYFTVNRRSKELQSKDDIPRIYKKFFNIDIR